MKGPSPGSLRALVREADALRRQSALLHRHLAPRAVALSPAGPPEPVVFLLHGVMATAGVFGPLEARLAEAGVRHVGSFSYHPFRGVESLARQLARAVDALPARAELHLVGHSLGGVVARYFVQELGGAARVRQTISLGSPFHGTRAVQFVPGALTPLAADLAPGSPLLARLCAPERIVRGVRHTSFVASHDQMVLPPESAAFPFGEVVTVADTGHNGLLFDRDVAAAVCALVQGRPAARRAAE